MLYDDRGGTFTFKLIYYYCPLNEYFTDKPCWYAYYLFIGFTKLALWEKNKNKHVQTFQLNYNYVEYYENVQQVMNVYVKIGMINNNDGKRLHWQDILIFWLVHSLSD